MPDYPRVNPELYQRGPSILGSTLGSLGQLLLTADERKAAREEAKYRAEDRELARADLAKKRQDALTAEQHTANVEAIMRKHVNEAGEFDEDGAYRDLLKYDPPFAIQVKAEWAKLKGPEHDYMPVGPNTGVMDRKTGKMVIEPTAPEKTLSAYDRFEQASISDYAQKKGKTVEQLTPGERAEAMLAAVKAYKPANQGVPPGIGSFEDFVTQKYGERPTAAQIMQARTEYGQADDAAQRPWAPIIIQTPTGFMQVDRATQTATPVVGSGGQQIALAPTSAQRDKESSREIAAKSVAEIEELSKKLINKRGIAQRATATGRSIDSALGNDPEYRTYQDARLALAGNLAVLQQGSRPSDADIKAIWLPMVPDLFRDTDQSAEMKWRLIKTGSGLPTDGSVTAAPVGENVKAALKDAAPGPYELSDGHTYRKASDGSITRVK